MPATMVATETRPATRPAVALVAPRSSPCDARMRSSERVALTIANGPKMPNGRASRPSTRALVAARSLMGSGASPELAAPAKEQIKDGPDAPGEGDDDPEDLPETAHVLAVDDVDHGEDVRNRMEKDREQDLNQQLHHDFTAACNGVAIRGQPPDGAYVPSAACS